MKKLFFVVLLVGLLVACSPTFPTPVPSPTATPFEYALLLSPSAPTPKMIGLYFGSDCLGDGQPDETHSGRGNSGGEHGYCLPEGTPEPVVLVRVERDVPPTQATSTVAVSTPTDATPTATTPEVPTSTPEPPVVACVGNPGNHSCNGNAGEDPNGKGTMPLDSTDGNGQHGNSNRP